MRREALVPVGPQAYTHRYRTRSDNPKTGITAISPLLTSTASHHLQPETAITSRSSKGLMALILVAAVTADTAMAAGLHIPTTRRVRGHSSVPSTTETGESRITYTHFKIGIARMKPSHRQPGVGPRGTKEATVRTLAVTTTPLTGPHPQNHQGLRMITALASTI